MSRASVFLCLMVLWWTRLSTVNGKAHPEYQKADHLAPPGHPVNDGSIGFFQKVYRTTYTNPRPAAGGSLYPRPTPENIQTSESDMTSNTASPTFIPTSTSAKFTFDTNLSPVKIWTLELPTFTVTHVPFVSGSDYSEKSSYYTWVPYSVESNTNTPASPGKNLRETLVAGPDKHIQQAKEHAITLQRTADETGRILEPLRPDKYEIHISALDRLYRVALWSMKTLPAADPEDVEWAHRWRRWWGETHASVPFDTRSAPQEFFAYAVERHLSFIDDNDRILEFEKSFDREYLAKHNEAS